MAEVVGEAALGLVFSELYRIGKDVLGKSSCLESRLEDSKSALNCVEPIVERIIQLSNTVNPPREETEGLIQKIEECKNLFDACSNHSESNLLNLLGTYKVEDDICKLEEAIRNLFQIYIPLYLARIGLEDLAVSNDVRTKVDGVQNCVQSLQTGVQTGMHGLQIGVSSVQITVNGLQTSVNTLQTSVNALHQAGNLGMRNARLSCAVPLLPELIVGLDNPLEALKRRLLNEKVSPLLLTGSAGCGKTTLAIRFGHDQQIKDVFKENIFFITVSPDPKVRSIARDIFDHLGRSVPEFRSDEHAIHRVGSLLAGIRGPILLIMDDVWPTSKHLVMKFKFNIPNYYLLETSRTAIVEHKFVYTLQPLDDEHATTLLCHSAQQKEESHLIPEECIKKVLRDCGGNPLALEEIGRSFRGQPSEAWQSWVMDRSDGHLTLDSSRMLLECLLKGLSFLDDKVKECFLDLALFPLLSIPRIALIEIWTVLYKLDRAGVRAITILTKISSHNLADVTRDYDEYFVKQHNLLREVAIHHINQEPIGQRKRLILSITENKSLDWQSVKEPLYVKARSLSVTIDEQFYSSEHIIQPSEVEVLVLNFQQEDNQLLKFVKKMEKLKVLIVTNYGFPCAAKQENWSAPGLRKMILENGSTSLVICCIGQASGNCDIKISNALPNALPNAVEIHMGSCRYLVELPVGAFRDPDPDPVELSDDSGAFEGLVELFGALEEPVELSGALEEPVESFVDFDEYLRDFEDALKSAT